MPITSYEASSAESASSGALVVAPAGKDEDDAANEGEADADADDEGGETKKPALPNCSMRIWW